MAANKGLLGMAIAGAGAVIAVVANFIGGKMQGEANAAAAGAAQAKAYKDELGSIEPPKVPSGNIEPTGQVQ